jgi:hypothetical protein
VKQIVAVMALGVGLVGCAADQGWKTAYENERATRQVQEARIQALENQQRQQAQPTQRPAQPTQPPPPARPTQPQRNQEMLTLEQILHVCKELKDHPRKYGVSCDMLDVEKEEPTLAFGFKDMATYNNNFSIIVDKLAGAYCAYASNLQVDGYVSFIVFENRLGSIFSCQKSEYITRWEYFPPRTPSAENRQY